MALSSLSVTLCCFILPLVLNMLVLVDAETFNVAFAASVESRLEQLLSGPSIRALNPLAAAFSSKWDYIFEGDEEDGGRNHQLIDYVDVNGTMKYMWTLMKPTDAGISGVDFVYAGFENGMFIGYKGPAPIQYVEMRDGNSSCPGQNLTMRCRRSFENSTDQTTGEVVGEPSLYITYDPRYRPWYTQSLESTDGDTWTAPYVFASNGELGITATKRIETSTGQVLGIAGVDYKLSTLDYALAEQELKSALDTNEYVTYVVQSDGYLIASSMYSASVHFVNGKNAQVLSYNSSNKIIAETSQHINRDKDSAQGGGGGWASSNGTVLTVPIEGYGLYWTQVRRIENDYGLSWYVVVVELVSCDLGYYSPPVYEGKDCVRCPTGGVCDGGSSLPYPEPGYWVDRSQYKYGGDIFRCVIDTCVGYEAREDKVLANHDNVNCWSQTDFNRTICSDPEALMCSTGATGPLCGTCQHGYHYDSSSRRCENCLNKDANIPFYVFWALVFLCMFLVVIFVTGSLRGEQYTQAMKVYAKRFQKKLVKFFPFNLLKHIDSGMAKVIWNTTQIISTIPWNLQMKFPDPFSSLLESHLVFFQLDFFPLHCFFSSSNFLTRVYIVSLTPLILISLNGFVYLGRCLVLLGFIPNAWFHPNTKNRAILSGFASQHAYFALVLSYLVLPVVSMVQFSALECVNLREGTSYLRVDTAIDCHSKEYELFVSLDALLIVIYQSVPLIWFTLLWRARHKLNPQLNQTTVKVDVARRKESVAVGFRQRDRDSSIRHLAFLWEEYRPTRWYYEVFEMYRRILFIAVLPLVGSSSELRAVVGALIAIVMISVVREASPFIRPATNILVVVASFQILLTFYAAVLITSGALDRLHLSNLALGFAIFCVNLAVITVVISFTAARLYKEVDTRKFKAVLSDKEYQLVNEVILNEVGVMPYGGDHKRGGVSDSGGEGEGGGYSLESSSFGESLFDGNGYPPGHSFTENKGTVMELANMHSSARSFSIANESEADGRFSEYRNSLRFSRVTKEGGGLGSIANIPSQSIVLEDKLGSASFGDIIKGTCFQQPVVIKTLHGISESRIRLFRDEIIVTAQLRHPNIAGFIGACWDRELICMVMEYVPNGSLALFLTEHGPGNLDIIDLQWNDPLLRLAIDIAKGMKYLHEGGSEGAASGAVSDSGDALEAGGGEVVSGSKKMPLLHLHLNPNNCLLNDFICIKLNLDLNKWSQSKHSIDSLTDKVNYELSQSPLFIAPELMICDIGDKGNGSIAQNGTFMTEKCDVYSFGMVLASMVLHRFDFMPHISSMWKKHVKHLNGSPDMLGARCMLKSIYDKSWQLQTSLKNEFSQQNCPPSIQKLISMCCSNNPNERPTFKDILISLKTDCSDEIDYLTSQSKQQPFQQVFDGLNTLSTASNTQVNSSASSFGGSLESDRLSQRLNAASVYKSNQTGSILNSSSSSSSSSSNSSSVNPIRTKPAHLQNQNEQVELSSVLTNL